VRPVKSLKGKKVAIIGLGQSQIDYVVGVENSIEYDEIWGINSAAAVFNLDRLFMLDPVSRFLDTDDAGMQTNVMRKILPKLKIPIYSCQTDSRAPEVVEYPLEDVINGTKCAYLNNTVAYAIAFASWCKVGQLDLFGLDYSYKNNLHFAEAGRACVEFWISKCISENIIIGSSAKSSLLDQNVNLEERLYGYHRLADPKIAMPTSDKWLVCNKSDLEAKMKENNIEVVEQISSPEPYKG
jgi:hypothetical protein|tara:strand:+ start:827 stop:1546 length:720 start_codon:yes stop_codon:yes gene_type:complete